MKNRVYINISHKPVHCKECGGDMIFKGVGEYQCEKCGALDYDDYGIVRNYIEKNKGATTAQIAMDTGVSQSAINAMLREERFEISANSKSFLQCEGCGAPIRIGRYCPTCLKLAEAANLRRKKAEEIEEKRRNISGTSVEKHDAESGAKRFERSR